MCRCCRIYTHCPLCPGRLRRGSGTRLRFGKFIRHGWVGSEFLVARRVLPDASCPARHDRRPLSRRSTVTARIAPRPAICRRMAPRQAVANTFVYATCTRLGAIFGRTRAVPSPYWQRSNLLSYWRYRLSSYLSTLVTETYPAVLKIRTVWVRVPLVALLAEPPLPAVLLPTISRCADPRS